MNSDMAGFWVESFLTGPGYTFLTENNKPRDMRVLAVSDIHGDASSLESILRTESGFDLVLVAGDITDTSLDDYTGVAEDILERLDGHGSFVKAVPGNMDDDSILELLIRNRVNLHKNIFSMEEHDFAGFGGGRTPEGVETPFEPEDGERGETLKQLLDRTRAERRVIVSHEPPRGTAADYTSSGEHVGSESLRRLIEDEDVELVVCGHIHEARSLDEVAGTTVVNPGPVNEGNYAVIDMEDGVEVDLRSV